MLEKKLEGVEESILGIAVRQGWSVGPGSRGDAHVGGRFPQGGFPDDPCTISDSSHSCYFLGFNGM